MCFCVCESEGLSACVFNVWLSVCVCIRGVTIHVFVLNRIGTDVTFRCMDLYGIKFNKTGVQMN